RAGALRMVGGGARDRDRVPQGNHGPAERRPRRAGRVMLTVDFAKGAVAAGDPPLHLGWGGGRDAFEAGRRGASVGAVGADHAALDRVTATFAAMAEAGEIPDGAGGRAVIGDATRIPFSDGAFDKVIAAEILEHLPGDQTAMDEIARVLRPGGTAAVTVP